MKINIAVCVLAATFVAPSLARAQQSDPIQKRFIRPPAFMRAAIEPRSELITMNTVVSCYIYGTGLHLNCTFDARLPPRINRPDSDRGGHFHNNPYPIGALELSPGPPPFLVERQIGNTGLGEVTIKHWLPRVAGVVRMRLDVRSPPGWFVVDPPPCDATRTLSCFENIIDVRLDGLVNMPDTAFCPVETTPYFKCRDGAPDHRHEDAYYGTREAVALLTRIAGLHYALSARPISLNDMSLPSGGEFDVKSDFNAPHSWHRTGESVDINRPLPDDCRGVFPLKLATALAAQHDKLAFLPKGKNRKGRFLCETNNKYRIHIDLGPNPPPPLLR